MTRKILSRLASIMVVLAAAATVTGAPQMGISPDSFNFGYAPQHAKVSHSFWLKSTGDDTLRIIKIIPGCGCTKAPLEKDVLLPGDSARLEIIFSTKTYRNRITKSPKITTNEGGPDRRVRIITHVVSRPDSTYPVIIAPYKLDMSQFTDKIRDRITFTLQNVSDREIRPTLIYAPEHLLEIRLPEKIAPGKKGEGTVLLNKQAVGESFEKSFTIEIDDEKRSRFSIPVKRTVRAMSQK